MLAESRRGLPRAAIRESLISFSDSRRDLSGLGTESCRLWFLDPRSFPPAAASRLGCPGRLGSPVACIVSQPPAVHRGGSPPPSWSRLLRRCQNLLVS